MDRALLKQTLAEAGEPSYRASQVWEWVARGAGSYAEMTNLPAALRERLGGAEPLSTLELRAEAKSDDSGKGKRHQRSDEKCFVHGDHARPMAAT